MGGTYNTFEKDDKLIQNVVGKPGDKIPLRRHGHRWEDNIKINITRIRGRDSPVV
jgi:hypothetical protein